MSVSSDAMLAPEIKPAPRRNAVKAEETRDLILQAAEGRFAAKGFFPTEILFYRGCGFTLDVERELFHPAAIFVGKLCGYQVFSGLREKIGETKGCRFKVLWSKRKKIFVVGVGERTKIFADDEGVYDALVEDLEVVDRLLRR